MTTECDILAFIVQLYGTLPEYELLLGMLVPVRSMPLPCIGSIEILPDSDYEI